MTNLEIAVIEIRLKQLERNFEALKRDLNEVAPILTVVGQSQVKSEKPPKKMRFTRRPV